MKNTINYYYNLNPDKIHEQFHFYYFYIFQELYYFVVYTRKQEDVQAIFEFNQKMVKDNILVHEIVNNRTGTVITYVNQIPYILVKISVNINKRITLAEIGYLADIHLSYRNELMRSNWAGLWAEKIDYLEYHHEQNYQKYPILRNSFNYFVGLAENAISYLNQILTRMRPEEVDIGAIAHDTLKLDDTVYALYDPLNIIIDHKARDVAEYIKWSFFQDNYAIFEELDVYFKHNYFSNYGINLILARVLYPSFYFEIYDEVVQNQANEAVILKITSRIEEYERYLGDVFEYFHRYYNVVDIDWLKKGGVIPR